MLSNSAFIKQIYSYPYEDPPQIKFNIQFLTINFQIFMLNFFFLFNFYLEMFEHMKNYEKLLEKISGWLRVINLWLGFHLHTIL